MKAVRFTHYGGPEVLEVADVTEPHAGPGQVRIRVQAAGVNPIDYKLRAGMLSGGRPLAEPVVTGQEAAGVVDEVGEGIHDTAVGDAVFGFALGGAAAEWAVLTHWARKPEALSMVQAGGTALAAETALRVLRELGVDEGTVLLIHGAGGGVGQAAVQFAREWGATVYATASGRSRELLQRLGATVIPYGPGLAERVALLTPRVEVVFDAAGSQLDDLILIAGDPTRIVTIANYAAAAQGVRTSGGGGRAYDALAHAAALSDSGRFEVRVARTYPLAEAAEAHRLSESRTANGKIVLLVP